MIADKAKPIDQVSFVCAGCGRLMVVLTGPVGPLCGACQIIPGWYHHPEIAEKIDPDTLRKPPKAN